MIPIPTVILSCIFLIVGLIVLIKGSDVFIDGAASLALKIGVSSHVIGVTLVALATSLPELGASSVAALEAQAGLAVGNVIGSNVINICLVMGAAALLMKLEPTRESLRDAVFMNFVVLLFLIEIIFDKRLNWYDGLVLLGVHGGYTYYLFKIIRVGFVKPKGGYGKDIVLVILGLLGVIAGAWLLVEGAVKIAFHLGVTVTVIGLTIVAIGTSLPELATSIQAARKKEHAISIGNVLGSNIINVLLVIGVMTILSEVSGIGPVGIEDNVIRITMPILIFVSVLALFLTRRTISRGHGIVLLALFVLFLYAAPLIV
jgi:cation:H+ antiporter